MGTDLEPTSGDLWLRDALGHEPGEVLSKADAFEVTAKIKSYAGVAWLLLLEAHKRQAHKAMGYPTWADYVSAEFDMSKSRSYQLISQAKVILELTEAVSTKVDVSERVARDLLPVKDAAIADAVEAVESLPVEATAAEKKAAVQASLDATRDAMVAKRKRDAEAKRKPKIAAGSSQVGRPPGSGRAPEQAETGESPDGPIGDPAALTPETVCPTCGGSGIVERGAA